VRTGKAVQTGSPRDGATQPWGHVGTFPTFEFLSSRFPSFWMLVRVTIILWSLLLVTAMCDLVMSNR
jgi:hypothetical protein